MAISIAGTGTSTPSCARRSSRLRSVPPLVLCFVARGLRHGMA